MTRDDFLDQQFKLSVQAGMNQRYHQAYATWWCIWDRLVKIVTAAAAVIGVMLSVATYGPQASVALSQAEIVLAIVTTIAAVALNVVPVGNWEQTHRDLFRQWTDLREDIDALLFDCEGEPDQHILCELRKLNAKIHRVCGQEPSPNTQKLKQFYNEEAASRLPTPAAA